MGSGTVRSFLSQQPAGPVQVSDKGHRDTRSLLASVLFGLVSGSCDACGYLALHRIFTANITGDIVLLGADWASRHPEEELGRLLALPVFIGSVWAARMLAGWLRRRGIAARRTLLLLMLALLAAFWALGVAIAPFSSQDAPNTLLVGMIGVVAMALLNVVARLWPSLAIGTTAMTGNMVKLLSDIAELSQGERPHEPHLAHDAGRLALSVAAFAVGCALAALIYAGADTWCNALPFVFGLLMVPASPKHPDKA